MPHSFAFSGKGGQGAESAIRIREVESTVEGHGFSPAITAPNPLSFRTALAVRNLLYSADENGPPPRAAWRLALGADIARRWLDRGPSSAYKLSDSEGGLGASRGPFFPATPMKKSFPGYYRPSEAEFRKLWDKCLFVLDANVLLNLYRYSDETRKKLLDIMQQIKPRLWVPHQAALEYQRNRLEVISAQREAYKQIGLLLEDTSKKLETQLRTYKRHPLISAERLYASISEVFSKQLEALKKVREKHPDLLNDDPVREALTKLLDGRVGPPYADDRLKQIYKEGEERYAKAKPPGFKDAKTKEGDRAFGDLVLWYQVIDKATSDKLPIIIVTDDIKEDWWWRHEGKIVGPNPELVEEIRSKANVDFYMYVSDQFMEYAGQYLKQHVDQQAINEIREVRKHDEQQRVEIEQFLVRENSRLEALRHERLVLAAEAKRLRSEVSALSEHMAVTLMEPGAESQSARKLSAELAHRRHELEGRAAELEDRLRHLDHDFDLLRMRRNRLLHQGPAPTRMRFHGPPEQISFTAESPAKDAASSENARAGIEEHTDDAEGGW